MKKLIFIIFLTIPIFANSQNWNLFNINQKTYYAQNYGNSLRVETFLADSIKENQHQILYFNRKIGLRNECFDNIIEALNLSSLDWRNPNLIDSLVIKGDSVLYISDYNVSPNDTFVFFPNCQVNDSWTTTRNNIEITCVEKKLETFLGIEDSVKTFNISTNPYEAIQIKLSKTYGLIEFLPFREFIWHYDFIELTPTFKIIGFETIIQKVGFKKPEFEDFFHLKQGDKLYWRNFTDPDDITQPESISYQIDSIKYSYLSTDSVYYEYQMKLFNENGSLVFTGNYSTSFTNKLEGKYLNTPTSWFGFIPQNYSQDVHFSESLFLNIANNDTTAYFGYSVWGLTLDTSNCFISYIADYDHTIRYSTREGLIYTASFSWGESSSTLLGSIINGNINGNVNLPNNINEVKKTNYNIFPNPTNGLIKIETSEKIEKIIVLDITGKILKITNEVEIDLSDLKSGNYILQIHSVNNISTHKIVISND